jgi:hypothetical protein
MPWDATRNRRELPPNLPTGVTLIVMAIPEPGPGIIAAIPRLLRILRVLSAGRVVAARCGPECAIQTTVDAPHDMSYIL